ncbi:MAG: hypothetical protein HYZ84_00520, partial [Candidatus Omnitrophica bacterium]|nr:hypothetical protein [Candidatus Omnitrophota bacterium]
MQAIKDFPAGDITGQLQLNVKNAARSIDIDLMNKFTAMRINMAEWFRQGAQFFRGVSITGNFQPAYSLEAVIRIWKTVTALFAPGFGLGNLVHHHHLFSKEDLTRLDFSLKIL